MARPHTENLNSFDVTPTAWRPDGLPRGIMIRILNEDDRTGAVTAVLEVPAGWCWNGVGYCSADQDFFVLDGAIRIGGQWLENGGFCYYPGGVAQGGWETNRGCRLYAIFNDRPAFSDANESTVDARSDLTVPFLDSWAMDWFDPLAVSKPSVALPPGIFVKVLRQNPETGASSRLTGLMPGWHAEGIEVHPIREESLCISGDVNLGMVDGKPGYTLTMGSYYSRPPGISHGPLSTKNGNVGLVHTDSILGIDYQTHPSAWQMIIEHLRSYPWK